MRLLLRQHIAIHLQQIIYRSIRPIAPRRLVDKTRGTEAHHVFFVGGFVLRM